MVDSPTLLSKFGFFLLSAGVLITVLTRFLWVNAIVHAEKKLFKKKLDKKVPIMNIFLTFVKPFSFDFVMYAFFEQFSVPIINFSQVIQQREPLFLN